MDKDEATKRVLNFYRTRGFVLVKHQPRTTQMVSFTSELPNGKRLVVYGNNRMRVVE
jgi:hypothetical protein